MSLHITRRDATVWLATQSALVWAISRPLRAQSDNQRILRDAIRAAIIQGENLRTMIVDAPIPTSPRVENLVNNWVVQFAISELAYRKTLAKNFDNAFLEDVKPYVLDGFMPVYDFVLSAEVPPIPTVAQVQNTPINTICRDSLDTRENPLEVLVDIFFDALGVAVDSNLFKEFLEQDQDARIYFDNLASSISSREWTKMADLVDALLHWLVVGGGVRNLFNFLRLQEMAPEGFIRRIGWRISLRFVPIVGWLYLGAAIVLAIKANLHRFSRNAADSSC